MTLKTLGALAQIAEPLATVIVVYLAYHFAMRQIRNQTKIEVYSALMGTRHCLDGRQGPSQEKKEFGLAPISDTTS